MLNKISAFIRKYELLQTGDRVVCAVSGGADSVALLWALYLLQDKLGICLSAAHYNHGLRGEESDRDQAFVEALCHRYDIPLTVEKGYVTAGEKGLEAAARDARYAFLQRLEGKIATAHTANDNAETVIMHLIRGTGLKGLGGISPARGNIIRPMLSVTREEVVAFLQSYHLTWVEDSSNATDDFLRNRIRHNVMPILQQENPRISENLSRTALQLRRDEEILSSLSCGELPDVSVLRAMPESLRRRYLSAFLQSAGVKEPEAEQLIQAEKLILSGNPSARAEFSGGITICREYDKLKICKPQPELTQQILTCPGTVTLPEQSVRISCTPASEAVLQYDRFTVCPVGTVCIRSRRAGDTMRLKGGTKSLKELFIDKKIPAAERAGIPVIADDAGVLAVYGIGANLDRTGMQKNAIELRFETL